MTAQEALKNDMRFLAYCYEAVHRVLSKYDCRDDRDMTDFAMEVSVETLRLAFNGNAEVSRLREENRILTAQVTDLLRFHPSAVVIQGATP